MDGWAALNEVQQIAVFATLAASALLLAVSMIGQRVPANKYALAPTLLPIGVLTVLVIILAVTFRPREELAFLQSGLACVRRGHTYSIPAALLFWLVLRRGAILFPKLIGAAVGGLAGLAGFRVLEFKPEREWASHLSVALGCRPDRHGIRRTDRSSRRKHPTAAQTKNLLEPAALFRERLRLATHIRPFDGDIANGSGHLRRLQQIERF